MADIVATTVDGGSLETLVAAGHDVVLYHVVPGKVMAADVKPGQVPTVEGSSLTVTVDNGVMVDNANVIKTDIVASNGVIHVIDSVVLPN